MLCSVSELAGRVAKGRPAIVEFASESIFEEQQLPCSHALDARLMYDDGEQLLATRGRQKPYWLNRVAN